VSDIDLSASLKERARAEGFDLVGIAAASENRDAARLHEWIDRGFAAEMDYMKRNIELRRDPRKLLPGCRSVVAVAMSYHIDAPSSQSSIDPERAWVSRYAWGRDYHRLMKKRLVRVGRWLFEQRPESSWRTCVDTAPILERSWAAAAGLGWIGKNTMLINRGLGSELFLGILLSTVELKADEPTTAHCGRCTACLDNCPTKAFAEPGVLDARRCIAYLTVEHRSEITDELREQTGHHIAGCDICQEVCPWTQSAQADLHQEFQPVSHRFRPRLEDIAKLDEAGYRKWREGSSLNRIGYTQFHRNVAIAVKNAQSSTVRNKTR